MLRDAAVGRAGDDALVATRTPTARTRCATPAATPRSSARPAEGDEEMLAAGGGAVDVVLAIMRGYGLEGDDAIHAARAVRSALHGFVALEAGGGFGIPSTSTRATPGWSRCSAAGSPRRSLRRDDVMPKTAMPRNASRATTDSVA